MYNEFIIACVALSTTFWQDIFNFNCALMRTQPCLQFECLIIERVFHKPTLDPVLNLSPPLPVHFCGRSYRPLSYCNDIRPRAIHHSGWVYSRGNHFYFSRASSYSTVHRGTGIFIVISNETQTKLFPIQILLSQTQGGCWGSSVLQWGQISVRARRWRECLIWRESSG